MLYSLVVRDLFACVISDHFSTPYGTFLVFGTVWLCHHLQCKLYLVLDNGALFHSSQATELSIDFEEPA